MKTRIYLFTGFLDSGKTTFIQDTLISTDFCEGEKSLLIVSEQGEVEYSQEEIETVNCDIVYVTNEDEWSYEFFEELKKKYNPTQVLIELNGMFNVNRLMACSLPDEWQIVQVLTTIHASNAILSLKRLMNLEINETDICDVMIGAMSQKMKYDEANQRVIVLSELMNRQQILSYFQKNVTSYMTFAKQAQKLINQGFDQQLFLGECKSE